MIDTVIFDMDGVIIDSEPIYFDIEKKMFADLGISVPFEEHCSFVGTSSAKMWQTIVNRYQLQAKPEGLARQQYDLYMDYLLNEKGLRPVPGASELIQDLYKDNFKLVVASSSHFEVIDIVLKKFQIVHYFLGRISGTELPDSKPHPEIFLRAAKLADSQPSDCIVIEDSANGVKAAKAAGMKCIGFLNPNSGIQDLAAADLIVTSLRSLDVEMIKFI